MKQLMSKSVIFGIALFVALPAGWTGEFHYAAYIQTTLQAIIAEEQNRSYDEAEAKINDVSIQLECQVNKYRVSCCFSDNIRIISEKKKDVIMLWMEALKIDPRLASLYRHEILVREGTRLHWIPVQEQLLPHMKQELVNNETIELFIIFTGKVESEYVFIATEFSKPNSLAKNSIQATASTRAAP